MDKYGQDIPLGAEKTNAIGDIEKKAFKNLIRLCRDGIERLMIENKLDALVTLNWRVAPVLAIRGYPVISVPAGYEMGSTPFGICFSGLKGWEPRLIEIA